MQQNSALAINSKMDLNLTTASEKCFTTWDLANISRATVTASTIYPELKHPWYGIVGLVLTYCLVFIIGIVGNCVVITVFFSQRIPRNITTCFMVNLAVANFFVCVFCLPTTLIMHVFTGWQLGEFMCKAAPYLQAVSVSASVNTLAAIALDRYLAICHSFRFRISKTGAIVIIAVIWTAAFLIMVPWLIYYTYEQHQVGSQHFYFCYEKWPADWMKRDFFLYAIFLTCYTIPLLLISVFYTLIGIKVWKRKAPGEQDSSGVINRSKVKVVKMLLVVVALFAVSWLPQYITWIVLQFVTISESTKAVLYNTVMPIFQWLGTSNSCVNPIIYCYFSKKFRIAFFNLIRCRGRRYNSIQRTTCRQTFNTVTSNRRTESQRSGNGYFLVPRETFRRANSGNPDRAFIKRQNTKDLADSQL